MTNINPITKWTVSFFKIAAILPGEEEVRSASLSNFFFCHESFILFIKLES